MNSRRIRRGAALLLAMIILATLSAWAVAICSSSGVNVQLAENQRKADGARASAESGLEIMRFWLGRFSADGKTDHGDVFEMLANSANSHSLQADLDENGISNITTDYTGSTITVPSVTLDSLKGQSFSVQITQVGEVGAEMLQVDVTGTYGSLTKTLRANYQFGTRPHTVFDYGVATKGPLSLAGNIDLEGVNVSVESDVYIESPGSNLALSITGNSHIDGDVHIANGLATVDLQGGQASIGGETGQAAIDNHVSFGVPMEEFPEPDPGSFEQYAVNTVDSSTDTTSDATFENVRIVAGTNPTFSGHVTLKGVVFIETPNVVTFTGGSTVTAIIVGDGSLEDDSGTNQIKFDGNVESHCVSELPNEAQFEGLRDETGTFIVAPGFHLSFGGSFDALSGAIAGNGIEFRGNAGGTINGSVINYSDDDMPMRGNSDLLFNRSGTVKIPAGFIAEIVLRYDPSSYSEVTN